MPKMVREASELIVGMIDYAGKRTTKQMLYDFLHPDLVIEDFRGI